MSPDDVQIWLLDPAALGASPLGEAARALLSPDEQARARRFVFPRDRDAYVAAHALTRALLGRQAGVAPRDIGFATDRHGKPRLVRPALDRELHFNISHTHGLVACAIAWDRAIGIDVEAVRDPPLDLVDRYFSPPEVAAIRALDPAAQRDAFFTLWTLKESFIKALGLGLSMPLDRFALEWSPPRLLSYGDVTDTAADWHFLQGSPTGTCRLALCVSIRRGPVSDIETRWMAPEAVIQAAGPA